MLRLGSSKQKMGLSFLYFPLRSRTQTSDQRLRSCPSGFPPTQQGPSSRCGQEVVLGQCLAGSQWDFPPTENCRRIARAGLGSSEGPSPHPDLLGRHQALLGLAEVQEPLPERAAAQKEVVPCEGRVSRGSPRARSKPKMIPDLTQGSPCPLKELHPRKSSTPRDN